TVSADPTGRSEGTYVGAITFAATGATNSPASVTVTLNVNSQPKIGLNPRTLSFTVSSDAGTSSPSAVSITNAGFGTLVWTVSSAAGWLRTDPGGGSLGALASQPVLLTGNGAGMTPGVYTTTVEIDDPNALNSPQILAVDLTVTPPSLPVDAPAGQCGLLGIDALALLLVVGVRRNK